METNWKIDNMHSEITFKVRHMMISNVTGFFSEFDANIIAENEEFSNAKFNFNASIDSIQTGVKDRDEHLKSADFFDSNQFPKLNFESTSIRNTGTNEFEVDGIMSIKGIEKPLSLNVHVAGVAVDPYGQTKVGMEITGKIKRSEFGLTWSAVTEAGNVVVSDDIHVHCELQFIKQ
jgi:polyisoprenoid-binding protein YceI